MFSLGAIATAPIYTQMPLSNSWLWFLGLPLGFFSCGYFSGMGHFPTNRGLDDPGFRALVGLVSDGAWVKLSGAYRISVEAPPYEDVIPFAKALLRAAPNRCVWGSDWPHVAHWAHPLNAGDLLDGLAGWAPDEASRECVLVQNPARLYGFGEAVGAAWLA